MQDHFFKGKKSKFYRQYKKENKAPNIQNNNKNNSSLFNSRSDNDVSSLYNSLSNSNRVKSIKKIVCVFQKNSAQNMSLGVSYVIPSENGALNTIYTGDYSIYQLDTFELFLTDLQPEMILLHCPSDSKLKDIFKFFESKVRFMQYMNVQYNEISEILKIYFRNLENEDNKLNSVKINSTVSDILDNLSEASQASFYTILTLVLKFLNSVNYSNNNANYYDNDHQNNISSGLKFEKIIFKEILFVSKKTQKEIKIFEEKLHPSLVKGKGKSKEGFSLFNIFNKCITNQGRKLMRNMFQYPLKNNNKLNQRLDCIEDFYSLKNYSIIKFIINELRCIRDLEKNLNELKKFMINFKIWNGIFYSFESLIKIFEIFKKEICANNNNTKFKLLYNIFNRINKENITKVYDFLTNCLDFMKDEIKPKIKVGINEDLDNLRTDYNSLNEVLSKYAIDYSEQIPKNSFMDKFLYVFLPQLGYMFAVEKSDKYFKFMTKVNCLLEDDCKYKGDEEMEVEGVSIKLVRRENINLNEIKFNNEVQINDKVDLERMNSDLLMTFNMNDDFYERKGENKKPNLKNNEEDIIEEEDINDEEDEEECENNKKYTNFLLNSNKKDNADNDDQDNQIDFQNYEETLILQQISFPNLKISFQFHSDDMIYFKNDITAILDNQYGDLSARITDIENAIFREISKQILEFEKDILLADEFIASLDCYLHYFILSEKLDLSRPIIDPNEFKSDSIIMSQSADEDIKSRISFIEGRNIITELMAERRYIKTQFDCKDKNIFLISGNISSGKSVFLRQIGMSIYLAQIGSFVPAKNFKFNLFNKILTNIEIFESSLDHLSGFTIELKEIKAILDGLEKYEDNYNKKQDQGNNFNNSNTLVLLDDPYRRTSIHNKNCLLAGTITFLNNLIKSHLPNLKIFMTTSIETKNFLVQNNIFDYSITSVYEMTTQAVAKKINLIQNINDETGFVNLFEMKDVTNLKNCNQNEKKGINNINLFLAKENGLDNQIFLRSIEISNLIQNEKKMAPDLHKLSRIVEKFKLNRNMIKMNADVVNEELLERINSLLSDEY